MGFRQDFQRFRSLYEGENALSKFELLHDLLDAAHACDSYVFAQIACLSLFGHSDPRDIQEHQVDMFVDTVDPIVSAAIGNTQLKQ